MPWTSGQRHVERGFCQNGDGRLIAPGSKSRCRECLDVAAAGQRGREAARRGEQEQPQPTFHPRRPGRRSFRVTARGTTPTQLERDVAQRRRERREITDDDLYVVAGHDEHGRQVTKVGRGRDGRPSDAWFPGFTMDRAFELTGAGEREREFQTKVDKFARFARGEYFYGGLARATAIGYVLWEGGHELEALS